MRTIGKAAASAAFAVAIGSAAHAQDNVTIGAASVGGTYYVWAGGLANVLSQAGMDANVEVTGGPLHNIQLVDAGEMQLGLSTAAPAYEGFNGIEWADGEEYDNIRAVLPMYPSFFTWWSLKTSGIESFQDLDGNVVAMGPTGGTPDTYGRVVYKQTGVTPSRMVNAGFSDIVNLLRDGQIDAAFTTAGLPHPAVAENESTDPINLITLPPEISRAFIEEYPYFGTGIVPAGTYEAVTEDQETLTVWNFVITNADMPEDTVYEIVKAVFENQDAMIEAHPASRYVQLENISEITIPLHPGALRYYEEQGVEIPDRLRGDGSGS
ncbi:MAG: TAXI family TRAP transporter solute-binding subunit [Paracoccaceae bacterium]|jgi:TRAP transporter TAXI family solute receptor|nr:TAXI family TRAP transporter solute-binding subunit [Paracoccaceae bacterium]